jgi:hypothetical protein
MYEATGKGRRAVSNRFARGSCTLYMKGAWVQLAPATMWVWRGEWGEWGDWGVWEMAVSIRLSSLLA